LEALTALPSTPRLMAMIPSHSGLTFNPYAEKLNGRLAMMGFAAAIACELVTDQGIIPWLTHL